MQKLTTRTIAEIGIFSAIALALDFLASGIWKFAFVNGGSISIAMIPILVLAFRRGFLPGLISGIIVSVLQMLGGIYVIAGQWWGVMFQVLLDYILAYPFVAIGGIFAFWFKKADKKTKITYIVLACVVGGMLKYLVHFLSGVIFWSSSIAWNGFEGMPILYSLAYNGAYCIPNIIISAIVMVIMFIKAPQIFIPNDIKEEQAND